MNEWLDAARVRLARAVGDYPAAYELSQRDIDDLLELARLAAHESGERTSAPLLCYLLGVARGRHADHGLGDLVAAVGGDTAPS